MSTRNLLSIFILIVGTTSPTLASLRRRPEVFCLSSRADAHNSANLSKQRDDRMRSRSTKLLKSMSCSGLGLGGWLFSLLYRDQTLGLRSDWPSSPHRGSGAKLLSTQSTPDCVRMQILCRQQPLACCSAPTTRLTLARRGRMRKLRACGNCGGSAENAPFLMEAGPPAR